MPRRFEQGLRIFHLATQGQQANRSKLASAFDIISQYASFQKERADRSEELAAKSIFKRRKEASQANISNLTSELEQEYTPDRFENYKESLLLHTSEFGGKLQIPKTVLRTKALYDTNVNPSQFDTNRDLTERDRDNLVRQDNDFAERYLGTPTVSKGLKDYFRRSYSNLLDNKLLSMSKNELETTDLSSGLGLRATSVYRTDEENRYILENPREDIKSFFEKRQRLSQEEKLSKDTLTSEEYTLDIGDYLQLETSYIIDENNGLTPKNDEASKQLSIYFEKSKKLANLLRNHDRYLREVSIKNEEGDDLAYLDNSQLATISPKEGSKTDDATLEKIENIEKRLEAKEVNYLFEALEEYRTKNKSRSILSINGDENIKILNQLNDRADELRAEAEKKRKEQAKSNIKK